MTPATASPPPAAKRIVEIVAFDFASSTAVCPGASHVSVVRAQPQQSTAPSYFDFAARPSTPPTPMPTTPTPTSTSPSGFCHAGGSPCTDDGSRAGSLGGG